MSKSLNKAQNWTYYNCLQQRALLSAKSINDQLQDLLREVDLERVQKYFESRKFKLD